jgi:methyl-accepting chemotaxis protein
MNDIKESSQKIEQIVSVIDDIAFQTNILAFNASVQAAHAGMHGQGFAVVASEVRNLAQRTSASAEQIKDLVENSVKRIDGGSKLASQAGSTMKEILSAIHGVTAKMSEITNASVEQNAGIGQINLAITQMDDMTQQNAALVEQAAASAESLEEQVQNLAVTVSGFRVDKKSGDHNAPALKHATETLPEFSHTHHHRGYREHIIWDTRRTNSSHENTSAKSQMLAVANGDWEEF